jgi:hypothetical protein
MKKVMYGVVVSCFLVTAAFAQINNATLTGTVADASGAVLPGVSVTATNTATGVISQVITNEAGAYTMLSLLPGTYTVVAELPGFQKQTYSNTVLGNAVTVRLNFSLQVANQAQSVEVTIAADTLLATSSPTIGQALTEKKVSELPTVGNNVLDQLLILGGLDNFVATSGPGQSAFGREGATLAGISAQATPVLRDGIMVQDTRWPTGINSATVMNQDLVGEVRLIVAPVDAELGRGNGAVQITTRSGTNQFHGAATWNIQNSAMNANTWSQNRTNTPLNWLTDNQGTISAGGPIIKNKTFYYALWDMNFNRQRAYTSASVLTPCARNGIFRYFDGWNNGAYGAATAPTGATPTRAVVNADGTPANITTQPNGQPSQLRYISVFGPVTFNGAPNADCSNAVVSGSPWDSFRTQMDPTGLIKRTIALMPQPNDWNSLNNTGIEGLNTASYRYLRPFKGLDNLFSVGENTGNRRQINVRIDHNFNQRHRANVNLSYERVVSDDTLAALPGTWSNQNYHRPTVLTAGFVSTLSGSFVNEAKFGYRVSGTNVIAPWDLPENEAEINKYLPAPINGFRILPDITGGVGVCSPITGARPPGNCLGGGAAGNNITATAQDRSPIWTYGDTLSWTKGKHTIKYGGEIRFASSETQGSSPGLGFFQNNKVPVVVVAGAAPGATLATAGATSISSQNLAMSGIGTNDATKARNLLNFLSGSLTSINNEYFLSDPKATTFSDYRTSSLLTNTVNQREFDLFFKDDYKVQKNLTLNLGLRYEWYGVPYSPFGLTAAAVGGGAAAFGISGRDFSGWMNPSARADQTIFQFVGPNSPNSGKLPYNDNWKNFGPAVGFAYQLPFLGEGKTTVRGGYQITYQGGSRFSALENALTQPPGRVYAGIYTGDTSNPYLDLTKITASTVPTPLPPGTAPLTPIPITDRSQGANFFDPNYTSPYVQNLTLSVTRNIDQNVILDVRYIGTLARRLYNTVNLNSPNFLYNGLGAELDKIRAGGESDLLNKMMNGVNICTTGCTAGVSYGAIGTTVAGVQQTAAYQLRSSGTFQSSLANGYWGSAPLGSTAVATLINTLDYTKASNCSTLTDPAARTAGNCNLPDVNNSVVRGAVMRLNGFAENFISTNPQFTTANYFSNMGNTNYHSLQVEATLRPTHGFSGTANYTFSKNLGLLSTFTNPVDRHQDYTIVNMNHPHIFRSNGNLDLPIGPGKLMFGNSSGVLARIIEGWRVGSIYTLSSGPWTSITANNGLYANGVPDIANADLAKELLDSAGVKWGVKSATGAVEGDYFDRTKWVKVADPQCLGVTSAQNLNGLQTGTAPRCTLQAIAKIVPDGTAGAISNIDGLGHSGMYVLQNPLPGKQGNLGQNVLRGLPIWRFDANISKSFKITESKSLQFRLDAFNVLNHAQPMLTGANNVSSLTINTSTVPFGQILQKNGQAPRFLQGQLRLNF